jgi:hypothetical protein
MQCAHCGRILVQPPGRGRRRRFCNDACKMRHQRGMARPQPPTLPPLPAWHHGRFEDYADAYAGQVQVILTDPPYGRKHVPIYQALARFAATVLAPKGYLICMCGWVEVRDVLNVFHDDQPGLKPLGFIGYYLLGPHVSTARLAATDHLWRRHHKCILWYQQAGGKLVHRRSGTTDVIAVPEPTSKTMDKTRFRWEQNLVGFEQLVACYTNNEDVICDPMMGAGTTLIAAQNMHRPRVIGIEQSAKTFATAHARLTEAGLRPGEPRPTATPEASAVPCWQQLELVSSA